MTPYTRELFWNSSYHSMVDGYYVKSEDITLKPLHKTRLNMLDECRDINLAVWKKDTPAYRLPWAEDFTYAVSGLCRSCGLSPSKAPGKTLDKQGERVDGIEGGLKILGHGTFRFNIEDDKGEVHTIRIPNSVFVPGLRYCLLSPQHWVQMANDHYYRNIYFFSITYSRTLNVATVIYVFNQSVI